MTGERSNERAVDLDGERDTVALDHCDRCLRPLPHTDAEALVCDSDLPSGAAGWGEA